MQLLALNAEKMGNLLYCCEKMEVKSLKLQCDAKPDCPLWWFWRFLIQPIVEDCFEITVTEWFVQELVFNNEKTIHNNFYMTTILTSQPYNYYNSTLQHNMSTIAECHNDFYCATQSNRKTNNLHTSSK